MSASFVKAVIQRVCVGVGAVLLLAATVDYWVVTARVNDEADERLAQSARMINQLAEIAPDHQGPRIPSTATPANPNARELLTRLSDPQIGFEIGDSANSQITGSDVIRGTARDAAPPGFADISIQARRWRIFTLFDAEGRWVRVGESYENRDAISHFLLFLGLCSLLLIPVMAFLMREIVWTSIYPIKWFTVSQP